MEKSFGVIVDRAQSIASFGVAATVGEKGSANGPHVGVQCLYVASSARNFQLVAFATTKKREIARAARYLTDRNIETETDRIAAQRPRGQISVSMHVYTARWDARRTTIGGKSGERAEMMRRGGQGQGGVGSAYGGEVVRFETRQARSSAQETERGLGAPRPRAEVGANARACSARMATLRWARGR